MMTEMTREIRDLMARLAEAEEAARAAIQGEDDEAAEQAMTKVRSLRARLKAAQELEGDAMDLGGQKVDPDPEPAPKDLAKEYTRIFTKAIRNKGLSASELRVVQEYRAAMHEGGVATDPDGDTSLVVPQDIQTQINELLRSQADLSQYIRVEPVNTLSGSRVLELDEDMVPLAEVGEYTDIPDLDNPKFTAITYQLRKRAGILPITNELLADSDQNILAYVTDWIARKVRVTRNSLIAGLLGGLTSVDITDHTGLRQALNVDIDPALSTAAVILTNQSGFQWLDEQEDSQGRPLLQPDPTQPTSQLYKGRPVVVVADRFLPNEVRAGTPETIWAPFYVGYLRQLAVLFTRGQYNLASTREGGQAWRRDTTELRVISRDDAKLWDSAAAVLRKAQVA